MSAASNVEELTRYLSMRPALALAARILPRRWAMACAEMLSLLLILLPTAGPPTYWSIRTAYGKGRWKSFRLTWGWLGRGYKDFVVARRILDGRENPAGWVIVERNAEAIEELRNGSASCIVATGHFMMHASYALYSPKLTLGRPIRVSLPVASPVRNVRTVRLDYQFGTYVQAMLRCWTPAPEVIFLGSDLRGTRKIYERLREPGNVVFLDVDAAWKKSISGSFERPFAGHRSRAFATGAAQLSRMAQCSVVACVPYLDDAGRFVLDWGIPIRAGGGDARSDEEVMNLLLDHLERAIGDRPAQYALDIGGERRWDASAKHWQE